MHFHDYVDPAERFALRELEQSDLAAIEAFNKAVFFPYLRHITGSGKFLEDAISARSGEPRALYVIGIVLPEDRRRLIGVVGAFITDASSEDPVHSAEVGYALIPDFQKRGIARSALLALVSKVLMPRIREVRATVDPENLSSIRLLEACGFERFGPVQPSKYLGDPDNPAHHESGILQPRPRVTYRIKADAFR